jgi:hypothetical protein
MVTEGELQEWGSKTQRLSRRNRKQFSFNCRTFALLPCLKLWDVLAGTSKNPLRVALAVCDARCTPVQLRFSTTIAAARTGF